MSWTHTHIESETYYGAQLEHYLFYHNSHTHLHLLEAEDQLHVASDPPEVSVKGRFSSVAKLS